MLIGQTLRSATAGPRDLWRGRGRQLPHRRVVEGYARLDQHSQGRSTSALTDARSPRRRVRPSLLPGSRIGRSRWGTSALCTGNARTHPAHQGARDSLARVPSAMPRSAFDRTALVVDAHQFARRTAEPPPSCPLAVRAGYPICAGYRPIGGTRAPWRRTTSPSWRSSWRKTVSAWLPPAGGARCLRPTGGTTA